MWKMSFFISNSLPTVGGGRLKNPGYATECLYARSLYCLLIELTFLRRSALILAISIMCMDRSNDLSAYGNTGLSIPIEVRAFESARRDTVLPLGEALCLQCLSLGVLEKTQIIRSPEYFANLVIGEIKSRKNTESLLTSS